MALIGKLVAVLTANTKPYEKNMKRAQKRTKAITASFMKLGGALGMAFGAGAIINNIKQTIVEMDQLGKTAAKLGIAVEQLSALHYAAKISGVEVRTFNMALQRMVRRVSEAAIGTGEARDAIKEMGLSAKELGKLAPDELLNRFANSMKGVKSQADRVRLAMKLFDSEGVIMVQMLMQGADALEALKEEAHKLGITIDDIDANKATEAIDAMTRMGAEYKAVMQEVAVAAAPIITELANTLDESQAYVERLVSSFLHLAETGKFIGPFSDDMDALVGSTESAAEAFIAEAKAMETVAAKARETAEATKALEAAQKAAARVFEDTRTPWEKYKQELQDLEDLFNNPDSGLGSDAFYRAMTQAREAFNAIDKATENAAKQQAKAEGESITQGVMTPLERYIEGLEKASRLHKEGALEAVYYNREVSRLGKELEAAYAPETKTATEQAARSVDFKQVALSRVALGGLPGSQQQSPQVQELKKLNLSMKVIREAVKQIKDAGVPLVWEP